MSPPTQYSPDGKWWWDGQAWQPVKPQAGLRRPPNYVWALVAGGVGLLLCLGVCGIGAVISSVGGGGDSGPSGDITGVYTLSTWNGHKIPAGGGGRLMIDGAFELRHDQTWQMSLSWRGELGYSRHTGDVGTFTRSGSTLNFQTDAMAPFTGRLSGNKLTVEFDFTGSGKLDQFEFVR
ncbi:MAG TPA: hypothetical protein VK131_03850 [Candidatus Acidoferrales bacterium]|nr:hypothetical protein [Candidatus Acidoferrales bacterium]